MFKTTGRFPGNCVLILVTRGILSAEQRQVRHTGAYLMIRGHGVDGGSPISRFILTLADPTAFPPSPGQAARPRVVCLPQGIHKVLSGSLTALVYGMCWAEPRPGRRRLMSWPTVDLYACLPAGAVRVAGSQMTVRPGSLATSLSAHF
ncbi:hypothetical protein B0T26DRAFT_55924 [Lasiosphaeria miniovina]|uniref:Uncharacterized protein n=1 Tax=Lasiosphaeria miniovina TaxID=1954250 RepID=A0AA40BH43_9PEZI|nr:uncharacterized protein B0T26DRAFT_55924 [Lasiosphaeria miniovina]KAK0734130.1 hypothetical protein B0T26DRAFT_55924 [Lasiosphaeria miniovina]